MSIPLSGTRDLLIPEHGDTGPLDAEELRLLAGVDGYVGKGVQLKSWWEARRTTDSFAHRFQLGRTFNEPSVGFGFFDTAPVDGRALPVMGNYQDMFYDRPKRGAGPGPPVAEWMREQIRAFALRYFMRVSDFRAPQGFAETWRPPTSALLRSLSWCPEEDMARRGFGFQQLYYKRSDGELGRFPEPERFAIIDLTELGPVYEWIVVKVCIFDFELTFKPFGADAPSLLLPLHEDSLLVLARDFITDETDPEPGVLGRYGTGYSFIRNPTSHLLRYGPGEFDAALEMIVFEVLDDGTVRVPMSFVANQPEQIVDLEVDPVGWGLAVGNLFTLGLGGRWAAAVRGALESVPRPRFDFDPVLSFIAFANRVSGGLAGQELCISREQLFKQFLVQHYMQHYETIAGSLASWRRVPDWLDTASLPEWAIRGRSF